MGYGDGERDLALPLDVGVAGQPGRPRDGLVRTLTACSLLRVGVTGAPAWRSRARVVVLRSELPARDVREQREAGRDVPILVVSGAVADGEIVRTLQAGATGFLVDGQFTAGDVLAAVLDTAVGCSRLSPAALGAVVRRLRDPDQPAIPTDLASTLSPRERQIMELVAQGHPNSVIARREFITEKTVRNHLNNIYPKLRVRSRADAILVWWGKVRTT
jgi:DNA-binding NarL/FixJ family response regulator